MRVPKLLFFGLSALSGNVHSLDKNACSSYREAREGDDVRVKYGRWSVTYNRCSAACSMATAIEVVWLHFRKHVEGALGGSRARR